MIRRKAILNVGALAVLTALNVAYIGGSFFLSQACERTKAATTVVRDQQQVVRGVIHKLNLNLLLPSDFVERLVPFLKIEPLMRDLQLSSSAHGVLWKTVSAQTREATDQTLGRVNIKIALNGAFPALKSVLAETLQHNSALVLQQLSLRRLSGPTDLQMQIDMMLVTRPLEALVTTNIPANQAAKL